MYIYISYSSIAYNITATYEFSSIIQERIQCQFWFVIFKYLLWSCNLTRISLISFFAPSFAWFEPSLYAKVDVNKTGTHKIWNFDMYI